MKRICFAGTAIAVSLLFTGCVSVEMATKEETAKAREFNAPEPGHAGVYVFRDSFFGQALSKDLWIDGQCLGESVNRVFFHTQVDGDKSHTLSTQSEFSPNVLEVQLPADKNYFFRQYIKMGVFIGGANLEQVSEEDGKKEILRLDMAKSGTCSDARKK